MRKLQRWFRSANFGSYATCSVSLQGRFLRVENEIEETRLFRKKILSGICEYSSGLYPMLASGEPRLSLPWTMDRHVCACMSLCSAAPSEPVAPVPCAWQLLVRRVSNQSGQPPSMRPGHRAVTAGARMLPVVPHQRWGVVIDSSSARTLHS